MVVFIAILIILILIFIVRINLIFEYNNRLVIKLRLFFFTFTLYKQLAEKEVNIDAKKPKNSKTNNIISDLKKRGIINTLNLIIDFFKATTETIQNIFKSIQIKNLKFLMKIGGKDASSIALLHGRACHAIYTIFGYISAITSIDMYDISIRPEYTSEKTSVTFELDIKVRIFVLLKIAFKYLMNLRSISNINV